MIPINLAIIGAGAQAGSRGRGFLLGAVYGARDGARLRRPRPDRHPHRRHVRHDQLVALVQRSASPRCSSCSALAMFDVIVIDFSRFVERLPRRRAEPRHVAAGVHDGRRSRRCWPAPASRRSSFRWCCSRATCTRPGTTSALALPFCLGIGMAVPWPIAGAGLAALPKPGAWMVRVKQALRRRDPRHRRVLRLPGPIDCSSNRWVDATEVTSSVEEKLKEGWHASLAEGLAAAERERKPVLIDMWATWCKNCLTMDKTTLAERRRQGGAGRIRQDQVPGRGARTTSPAKDVMQRFDAVGLPTYVILRPKAG